MAAEDAEIIDSTSVTEQPHKLPYYSALLMVLTHNQYLLDEPFSKNGSATNEDVQKEDGKEAPVDVKPDVDVKMEAEAPDVKMQPKESEEDLNRRISWLVIEDMNERFGKWVAERQWLKVRLCVSVTCIRPDKKLTFVSFNFSRNWLTSAW